MPSNTVRVVVVLALVALALAAAYVESLGLRVALVVVPALFLTQQALAASGSSPTAAQAAPAPPALPDQDRRSDMTVRHHIRQLLELIRDFYSTCHMVAVGQLSPAKAKSKARDVEEKLNEMMQDMLDRLGEEEDEGAGEEEGEPGRPTGEEA